MRSFIWLLFTGLLSPGLALVACGLTTTDPPSNDVRPAPGNACGTKGTTALAADGCNRCSCTEEGTWSCTELDCPADPSSCEEGDTKYADDGCNTCTCSEDGSWGCTLIGCNTTHCAPPKETDVACDDVIAYAQFPTKGECCLYPSPCQVPDDWIAFDTLEECEETCTPGAHKPAEDGCNTCTCAEDGTWGSCTDIACPELP